MKNKSIIIAAAAALILSACGKTESTPENISANEQQAEVYELQEGDTEVSGEVVSVIGNEVTLELGELSETQKPSEAPDDKGGDLPDMNSSDGNMPDFEQGSMPDGGGFGNGERPEPSDGGMPDLGSFDKGGNGGRQGGSDAQITKSGKTEAYIIPVGMTVSGLSGRSSDYSGISEGDILTLVVDSEGTVRSAAVR